MVAVGLPCWISQNVGDFVLLKTVLYYLCCMTASHLGGINLVMFRKSTHTSYKTTMCFHGLSRSCASNFLGLFHMLVIQHNEKVFNLVTKTRAEVKENRKIGKVQCHEELVSHGGHRNFCQTTMEHAGFMAAPMVRSLREFG